ncbi:MAG: hypothetical protein ACJ8C4_03750 [Gemmataceae bacterium]
MRKVILALVFAVVAWSAALAEPAANRALDLIAQLGSANYHEREAAFIALDALGEAGLNPLRDAAASPDSEIARRAGELIQRIEQRIKSAKTLVPTLVEVDLTNKTTHEALPLRDAVTAFRSQVAVPTGRQPILPIVLPPTASRDSSKFNRLVSYKSHGKIPAWQALDEFCKAANLSEWDGVTPMPGMPASQQNPDSDARFQRQVVFARSSRPSDGVATAKEIYLYDATPSPIPTYLAGAVRLRILPTAPPIPAMIADSGEFVLPLQVSIESKYAWHNAPGLKLAQAIDDRGQRLTASVIGGSAERERDDDFPVFMMSPFNQMPQDTRRSYYLPVRFRRGNEAAKTLREVAGTLSLSFRVEDELLTLTNPMQGVGKSARCSLGASLTLLAAERTPEGELKLDLNLESPADVTPQNFNLNQLGRAQMQMGGMGGWSMTATAEKLKLPDVSEYCGISIIDAAGKRIPISMLREIQASQGTDGIKAKLSMIAKLPKDALAPARIVFRAQHPSTIEVPFTFKDVPIP